MIVEFLLINATFCLENPYVGKTEKAGKFPSSCLSIRAMAQRGDVSELNENWFDSTIFDARFNGTIFSMIHGISADLFKILKFWSRRS